MEFSLAADGKVSELRTWLLTNRQRVNFPNTFTNYTLVYTATNHSNRGQKPSISALQAAAATGGHGSMGSAQLQTIRMLCLEFGADPCIPCGGLQNSCVFVAAELGSEDVLHFFFDELDPIREGDTVAHRYFMKPNALGETPLQAARRVRASASLIALLERRARLEEQLPPCQGTVFPARGAGAAVHRDPHSGVDSPLPQQRGDVKAAASSASASHADNPGSPTTQELRERLARLRVQDSDSDDDNGHGFDKVVKPATADPKTTQTHANANASTSVQNNNHNNSSHVTVFSPTPLPTTVLKRNELDISQSSSFGNRDLQDFRREFGNGFTYMQCRDHYDIRGLLPYTYRGVEYYTPMIFLIYGPNPPPYYVNNNHGHNNNNNNNGQPWNTANAANSPLLASKAASMCGSDLVSTTSTSVSAGPASAINHGALVSTFDDSAAPALVPYCRYRALVDVAHMDGFCINRKAEYIDPVSGAILPCACDGLICLTFKTFVQVAVLSNFQRVPPMTPSGSRYAFAARAPITRLGTADDKFMYHHSQSSPVDMRDVLSHRTAVMPPPTGAGAGASSSAAVAGPRTRLRHFRICQDLSRFGDGWLRYHPNGDFVNGFVPIYREKPKAVMTTVYGVAAAATAAAAASSTIPSYRNASATHPTGPSKNTQEVVAVEVELVLLVRVQIRFQDTVDGQALVGGVPVCYLVSADAGNESRFLTFDAFRPLLVGGDPTRSIARALRPDVLDAVVQKFATGEATLFELLLQLQQKLSATVEGYAKRYQSIHSSPVNRRAPGEATSGGFPISSPLDDFFASPTADNTSIDAASAAQNFPRQGTIGTAGVCVICFTNATTMVLQPCGHIAVCKICADRLENHNHKGHFPCPVCHQKVTSLEEVYL